MRISIITASVRGEFLDSVWKSIKKQTYKYWEWIIINDGTESVRDWFNRNKENLGENVWMVDVQKNRGRFGLFARNIGVAAASYDRMVFLDDDNEWEENHLESLVKKEQESGKVPYSWMHIKGKKKGSTEDKIKETRFAKQNIDLGCLLWRREHFEKYGYLRNDAQVTFDWNHMARMYFGEGPHNFESTEKATLVFWHKRY